MFALTTGEGEADDDDEDEYGDMGEEEEVRIMGICSRWF